MANSPNSGGTLIDEFRRQIGDTVFNYVQLDVTCQDTGATQALIEVSDNHLITVINGGTANSLDIDLEAFETATIERLVQAINGEADYIAHVTGDGEGTHAANDLEIIAPKDILRRAVQLKSRRWSDGELEDILTNAAQKLGRDLTKNYTLTTIPSKVKDLLFLLGMIGMYWDQINNATKRRGLDLRVDDFRTLHQAALDEYERSLKAFLAAEPPVTLTPEQLDDMGAGDIIVGSQYRRNLRTGRMTPSVVSPFPSPVDLMASFIGGAKIRLDWSRSRTSMFHHYEVWRGTTAGVNNQSEISRPLGALPTTGVKIAIVNDVEHKLWVDGGTSPLPPGTYYYRLYVYNVNGEWAASEVANATVT